MVQPMASVMAEPEMVSNFIDSMNRTWNNDMIEAHICQWMHVWFVGSHCRPEAYRLVGCGVMKILGVKVSLDIPYACSYKKHKRSMDRRIFREIRPTES